MVVLDTNILIDSLRLGGMTPTLTKISDNFHSYDIFVSTISIQELYVGESTFRGGIPKSIDALVHAFTIVNYTEEQAKIAGKLMRDAKRVGLTHTFTDMAIAACAIFLNAQLATSNIKHFKDIPNLRLFDTAHLSL